MKRFLFLALFVCLFTSAALANPLPPDLEKQVRSGQLTREEAMMLSGGMQRRPTSTPATPTPSIPQSAPEKTTTRTAAFNCDLETPTERSRAYRCCELRTSQAVWNAYHNGAYYLDHDTDGIACENYASTRVWNPVIQQNCANVFATDLRYFLTRNTFSPGDSQIIYRTNNYGRQIPVRVPITQASYRGAALVVDGHAVRIRDFSNGVNSDFPNFKEQINSHLRSLNTYADSACQNTSGLIFVTAQAQLTPYASTWDLSINGEIASRTNQQYLY